MRLTKVEADSMQEALRKIRSTLGDDAMIVGTRTRRQGGVLGVGAREVVEVYVADNRQRIRNVENEMARRQAAGSTLALEAPAARSAALEAERGRGYLPPRVAAADAGRPEEIASLSKALESLREEIRTLVKEKGETPDSPFLREAYELLLGLEVEERLASGIVQEMKTLPLPVGMPDPVRVRAAVQAMLRRLFLPNLPGADTVKATRVVVLVGPTGVGKTTTIAKLAARARMQEGLRVGFITLDTFRIAAVDQLNKYAQIMGIPLAVATDPVEFRAAAAGLEREGTQVIYVDTAGRSQRDAVKLGELREFLKAIPGAETHLVLSMTTSPKALRSVTESFGRVGFDRVILTKLDEAPALGALLEPLVSLGKPISFLTDGQNVPDDLMLSDPDRLAEIVVRAESAQG